MEEDELRDQGIRGNSMPVQFERVSSSIAWKDLFPQWDHEDISKSPQCPQLPMPDFTRYDEVDVVIAWLPCKKPEDGWNRDVFRLQVHMVSANLAARKGRRDPKGMVKVVLLSKCTPMMDIFRCDDSVKSEGEWWMYEANVDKLEDKLRLPLGSCKFALPIWGEGIYLLIQLNIYYTLFYDKNECITSQKVKKM
jgi:xylan alpha-glucuronosyltransferase